MKTQIKHLVLAVCLVLGGALAIGAFLALWTAGVSWWAEKNRASAMECTLEWARLAPFPSSAREFTITAAGSMFTRGFRASFVAPPAAIEEWLAASPGTREAFKTAPSPGVRHFEIQPGGGANRAKVTVDDTAHRVFVFVEWS
jgi:hypothetical protein